MLGGHPGSCEPQSCFIVLADQDVLLVAPQSLPKQQGMLDHRRLEPANICDGEHTTCSIELIAMRECRCSAPS